MATIVIDLPDTNSHEGVTKEYLEQAAQDRGCTVDRVVGVALAALLGFNRPEEPEDRALRERLVAAGIPQQQTVSVLSQLDSLLENIEKSEGHDGAHTHSGAHSRQG
ncbi:hypothetical protein [Niveibacterium sp. SC-1]|uniref:hypothetical protein n=1 Tax=Niveibacterium sp. SC-1 TaxID=3135646 RepID=UPI00311EF71A